MQLAELRETEQALKNQKSHLEESIQDLRNVKLMLLSSIELTNYSAYSVTTKRVQESTLKPVKGPRFDFKSKLLTAFSYFSRF